MVWHQLNNHRIRRVRRKTTDEEIKHIYLGTLTIGSDVVIIHILCGLHNGSLTQSVYHQNKTKQSKAETKKLS